MALALARRAGVAAGPARVYTARTSPGGLGRRPALAWTVACTPALTREPPSLEVAGDGEHPTSCSAPVHLQRIGACTGLPSPDSHFTDGEAAARAGEQVQVALTPD